MEALTTCQCGNHEPGPCQCYLQDHKPDWIRLDLLLGHIKTFWDKKLPAEDKSGTMSDYHLQFLSQMITETCPVNDGKA